MKFIKLSTYSIQSKIWSSMLLTIGILLVLFSILNFTLLTNAKKDVFYDQLKNAAHAKSMETDYKDKYSETYETSDKDKHDETYETIEIIENEDASLETSDLATPILIAHISISFTEEEKDVYIDRFTSTIYNKKEFSGIIPTISEEVSADTPDEFESHIKIDTTDYYYYVTWIDENTCLVFFLPDKDDKLPDVLRFGLLFIALIIISFFTSSFVAKKLAKPIKELESFANEISHRNWSARVPETDPDEIGGLAASLESMRDSLKIAEERDRQFLQSSSHDLKTPVMVIKGYAQAILDGMHVDSSDSAATVIKNEAEKLERRIIQLLRLNTLGHSLEHTEERDYVRIDRIINSLYKRCGVINPYINWDLSLEEIEIIGDSEALVIAFENLFENQLRYAASVISVKMDTDTYTILIENDGPHFTVNDPMVLFDSYKKDEEGKFGLGLAIVWQVFKSHNISIEALNTPRGVSFNINFNKSEG